jgi:hypothetical protein
MPNVLTTSSTLVCTHQAQVTLKSSQTKLKAGGSPVLGPLDLISAPISGCTNIGPNLTCTLVVSILAGISTTLTVNDQPVLVETAQGLTNGVPPSTWSVTSAGQKVLQAK